MKYKQYTRENTAFVFLSKKRFIKTGESPAQEKLLATYGETYSQYVASERHTGKYIGTYVFGEKQQRPIELYTMKKMGTKNKGLYRLREGITFPMMEKYTIENFHKLTDQTEKPVQK